MCGIAGFTGRPSDALGRTLEDSMWHRGPDDGGALDRPWATIVSRRLAIIDVAGGHQPMSTADGALHIAYNGEVYNFRELREELRARGVTFDTETDTEVVLKAYELDGAASFARLNGMFAFALLDERGAEPELILVRDQFGIKPLYHAAIGDRFVFASEIKSLVGVPGFRVEPNDRAIGAYLRHGLHDHSDRTFFTGVQSLPAAHYLVVRGADVTRHRYWEPRLSEDGDARPERLWELFRAAVERRLVSEVPVGCCLSGGLDSSSIVCAVHELIRERAPDAASVGDRLKTFSAVFPGDPIDERRWIEPVLAATGAEPHFTEPRSNELMREIADLAWALDEPVVSSGPFAQWSVTRLAQGRVTVLLDGQGGDELFGGYLPYRFVYLRELLRRRRFGDLLRQRLSWQELRMLGRRYVRFGRRAQLEPKRYLRGPIRGPRPLHMDDRRVDDLKARLLQDLTTYSLPSLLRYEDRISMNRSIESRVPFLDLELVEHVLSLPSRALMQGRASRAVFRDAVKDHLPRPIWARRKKIGFTTPEMRWLRRERAAVMGILRSPAFHARPYWDAPAIADAFEAICAGRMDESLFVWRVLNLELWLRVFVDRPASEAGRAPGPAWERIGDERAGALLGAAAREALAAEPVQPGRHLFATSPDGSVFARTRVPAATERLTDELRAGDTLAFPADADDADAPARAQRLLAEIGSAEIGSAEIGVVIVERRAGAVRIVARAGAVPSAIGPAVLSDDPFTRRDGRSGPVLLRPVGRLEAVAQAAPAASQARQPAR